MFDTAEKKEKAILIGLINKKQDQKCINEYLDELEFLIDTAGGEPGKRFIQTLDIPDSRTYIGSGKLDEIKEYVNASQIDVAVFDDELTPSQIRNIEMFCNVKSWIEQL